MAPAAADQAPPHSAPQSEPASFASRPWIGILFECCDVYYRIYRDEAGTAYEGRCPRCGAQVRVAIGPEGTDARFFRAE